MARLKIGLAFDRLEDYTLGPDEPGDALAELDDESTVTAVEQAIAANGHQVARLGGFHQIASGGGASLREIDLVFNMAEGRVGAAREAQLPALLEAFSIPYSGSDPVALAVSLDKALTKRIWLQAGLATAPFVCVSSLADLDRQLASLPEPPLFVKPNREGSSMGISPDNVVASTEELRSRVEWLLTRYRQEVLIEPFLPGREVTVGVLGEGDAAEVLGCLSVDDGISGYAEKKRWSATTFSPLGDSPLASECARLALSAYRCLGCRDVGRVDLRLGSDGRPQLLEINPLPGLRPERSALPRLAALHGLTFEALVGRILANAITRTRPRSSSSPSGSLGGEGVEGSVEGASVGRPPREEISKGGTAARSLLLQGAPPESLPLRGAPRGGAAAAGSPVPRLPVGMIRRGVGP